MLIEDWRNEAAYRGLMEYDGAAWAWEFLRSNPGYQAEWAEFDLIWQALEARYGRPPDRDFCAWKNDPRAWIRASDESSGECRVDHDKVLIECALGARWGFYKFPPDPVDACAALEQRIAWREPSAGSHLLVPGSTAPQALAQAAVRFDLDLPLKPQLQRAKRELAMEQRRRRREEGLVLRSIGNMRGDLVREMRILDAEAAGELSVALARLGGEGMLQRARAHLDGGYQALPQLPA